MIRDSVYGKKNFDIYEILSKIYSNKKYRLKEFEKFTNESHELVANKLIEINEGGMFGETLANLSDKAHDLIKKCNIKQIQSKPRSDIVFPNDILEKPLFFNAEDKASIEMMTRSLEEENFKTIY